MTALETARVLRASWPKHDLPDLDHACALAIAIGVELGLSDAELKKILVASFRKESTGLIAYCRGIASGSHPERADFDEAYAAVKNLIQPVDQPQNAPPVAPEASES